MMGIDTERIAVLDMVPIGLFVLDPDLVIRFWNRTLESWTGLSREEVVGHRLGNFYPHLLELRYAGRLEDVFHQGSPTIFSSQLHPHLLPVTLPGGRRQQQNVTVTAIRLDDEILGALVAVEDVTDLVEQIGLFRGMRDRALEEVEHRRKNEAELQRMNRELSVMHSATCTITSSGPLQERLFSVLEQLLTYLGFEAGLIQLVEYEEANGPITVHSGLSQETVEAVRMGGLTEWQQDRTSCNPDMIEDRIRKFFSEAIPGDGFLTHFSIPLIAEDRVVGSLLLLSARDKTFDDGDRALIDSIAREIGIAVGKASLEARLRDAHQRANLYLDILTHDVGNTVTTIDGAAELLALQMERPEQGGLPQIRRGIGKVTEIVRNVSTIRQIHEQQLILRPIKLDDLVRAEIEVFPDARIINEVPPLSVMADPLLGEVFTNLIGNSLKHGGRDVTVWIRAKPVGGYIECSVEDDGPGIGNEIKSQLFTRCEMSQRQSTGHGLGLYIVRSLVERYGGVCCVADRANGRPELGAAVHFTLMSADTCSDTSQQKGASRR